MPWDRYTLDVNINISDYTWFPRLQYLWPRMLVAVGRIFPGAISFRMHESCVF